MSFVKELVLFIVVRRKFWLVPVLLTSGVLGGLVVMTQGSAVAPFIYTLF